MKTSLWVGGFTYMENVLLSRISLIHLFNVYWFKPSHLFRIPFLSAHSAMEVSIDRLCSCHYLS